jgi:hypothetical protein
MVHGTTVAPRIPAALIWLDRSHALVARTRSGDTVITSIDRELDQEPQYLLRVAHEAEDCDRVVVTGADSARVAFEREYVAVYRRPDRLIDGGADDEPEPSEMAARLRLLTQLVGEPA